MELLKHKTTYINKLIIIGLLLMIVSAFSSFTMAQQEEIISHDLKNNPLEIKNFNKRNYSAEKDAIYFESNTPNSASGRLIVNINTLSQSDINISWQNTTANKVKTQWFAKLQYRLSTDSDWQDVVDERNKPVVYYSTYKRYAKNFNITLPKDCENQELVQLSWQVGSNTAKAQNPEILFRNIEIKSYYDKHNGAQAKVNVVANTDEKETINNIIFNNISLPFTFPEEYRIRIYGQYIRGNITLELEGVNKDYFLLSQYTISEEQADGGYSVSVKYKPKKEGRHNAQLRIRTDKMGQDILIPIEGSAANKREYNKNMLPLQTEVSSVYNFRIPVFSAADYQLRFSLDTNTIVYVKYHWYRDSNKLFSMYDTIRSNTYCAPLASPNSANFLEIELSASKDFVLYEPYFGTPKVKTMIRSGLWSDDENWDSKSAPVMEDFVVIDKGVYAEVDQDVACSFLILLDSANVNIRTGKTFYVSSDIFYNNKSNFKVQHYLLPGKWSYISSPINQAHAATFSMKSTSNDSWLMQYNTGEKSSLGDYWSEYITDPKFTLIPGRGYAVYTHDPLKIEYEGLLCSSSINIPLVSTEHDKWNLIGNPYTAPLSSKRLFEAIDGKIQGNVITLYDRENKIYNPIIVDPKEEVMIPSLQSFFVEALNHSTEITINRSHQYIPSTEEQSEINNNYLRLSVSKDMVSQYCLLGMVDEATFGFDSYDCHKMFGINPNLPEIFLYDGKDKYSVNVFPTYPAIYDVGLSISNPSEVEINLNNISVLPEDVMVFMEDKEEDYFYDFCQNSSIKTLLSSGVTDKYRIYILKAISLKNHPKHSGIYLWQDMGRVLLYCDMVNNLQQIRLTNKKTKTIIENPYSPKEVMKINLDKGTYLVEFLVDGKTIKSADLKVK